MESFLRPEVSFASRTAIHSVSFKADGRMIAVGTGAQTEVYMISNVDDGHRDGMSAHASKWELLRKLLMSSLGDSSRQTAGWLTLVCEPLLRLDTPAMQGGVCFSSGSRLAITGHQRVSVVDIESGCTVRQIERTSRQRTVTLSPDGCTLAFGGFDGKLTMHQVDSGAEMEVFGSDVQRGWLKLQKANVMVRSIHFCSVLMQLAVGLEDDGQGRVELYHVETLELVVSWARPKPGVRLYSLPSVATQPRVHPCSASLAVWAVCLSPDGSHLAAAGYDCSLALYDACSHVHLTQVTYRAERGPAFVWSLAFSSNGKMLAVGCWNGSTHVYRLNKSRHNWRRAKLALVQRGLLMNTQARNHAATEERTGAGMEERTPHLTLVTTISRGDRIYSVDLDASGQNLLIGGRDRKVALYDCAAAVDGADLRASQLDLASLDKAPTSTMLWEVDSDDFVYAVSLSNNLRYATYAGTGQHVYVLDGRTGGRICVIPCKVSSTSAHEAHCTSQAEIDFHHTAVS